MSPPEIQLSAHAPHELSVDLLAVGCDEESLAENPILDLLDRPLAGALRRALKDERFRGKPGQVVMLQTLERLPAVRLAVIGTGPRAGLGPATLLSFAGKAARLALGASATSLALVPPARSAFAAAAALQCLVEGLLLGLYRFEKYLAEDRRTPVALTSVQLILGPGADSTDASAALSRGRSVAAAISRARDLVNEPAAAMTPIALATVAREIAKRNGLEIKILGPDECRAAGMGLFLAVAQGSSEEPRFIHLAWKPAGALRRVVLIGKGVTFDSGGLSLKTNDGMLDMKTDMAGAAAVISAMEAVAALELPVEVHALAACTENMPSGTAYKLGDVLRSKAGKTVEINNTDAEGRLTLADAIAYALELRPDALFDFATLTGACVVALGPHIAGVMSNDEKLRANWLEAAKAAGEEMWPLPLPDRLLEQLKSDIADMKNTGERWGGALTAGLFLKEFVGDVPWVHVDIAGPSSADKESGHVAKGGTGVGVATIVEYLRRLWPA